MDNRTTDPHRNEKLIKELNPEAKKREELERKIDEQLEQTFPASDPPSFIHPGNIIEEKE